MANPVIDLNGAAAGVNGVAGGTLPSSGPLTGRFQSPLFGGVVGLTDPDGDPILKIRLAFNAAELRGDPTGLSENLSDWLTFGPPLPFSLGSGQPGFNLGAVAAGGGPVATDVRFNNQTFRNGDHREDDDGAAGQ